jgi:hypothetical protein
VHYSDRLPASLGRRQFVQGATAVLGGVLSALNPLAALLPSRVWAIDLHVLSADQSTVLLAMIHTIAPHDGLDESAYALVVGALDGDAAASQQSQSRLAAGLEGLGSAFVRASESVRVRKLEVIEPTPFFQSVRLKTMMVLYSNPIAWAHFGYEGEAFSKGGYLTRGFNDLRWLPEVPQADSGPMPV